MSRWMKIDRVQVGERRVLEIFARCSLRGRKTGDACDGGAKLSLETGRRHADIEFSYDMIFAPRALCILLA